MFKKMILVVMVCVVLLVLAQPARADGPVVLGMGRLTSIAVSPDGARLAVGTAIGVYFYDALTFAPQGFWDTGYSVTFLRWSPRGDVLAVVHDYVKVDFRAIADSRVLWSTTVPKYGRAVEFTPDGAQAIVSTRSKYANVFDALSGASQGKVIDDLISMPGWLTSISPDRQWQASSWDDCAIWLKAFGGVQSTRYTLPDPNGNTICKAHIFAWSPDSLTLYSAGSSTVYAWDVTTRQPLRQLKGFSGPVTNVVWSTDGRSIISYEGNNLVATDVASGMPVRSVQIKQTDMDLHLLIAPSGELVLADRDGRVTFYSPITVAEERHYTVGRDWPSYALSPDGRYLAVSGYGPFVNIRDAATGKAQFDLAGTPRDRYVTALAFSGNSQTLYAFESINQVRQWDLTTHTSTVTRLSPLCTQNADVYRSALHIASQRLVVLREDSVAVCDLATGDLLYSLTQDSTPIKWQYFRSFIFNSQGTRLAAFIDYPREVKIWDMTSGALVATYTGHTGGVNTIAFNPAGDLLATGSGDGTIRIWPVP